MVMEKAKTWKRVKLRAKSMAMMWLTATAMVKMQRKARKMMKERKMMTASQKAKETMTERTTVTAKPRAMARARAEVRDTLARTLDRRRCR